MTIASARALGHPRARALRSKAGFAAACAPFVLILANEGRAMGAEPEQGVTAPSGEPAAPPPAPPPGPAAPPGPAIEPATAPAIERPKLPVYAEVGLGFGQTLFFGDTKDALRKSYGGAFDPGTGQNVMFAFFVAPASWHRIGVGGRIKGTFGSPVKGDNDDDYIFNYYAFSVAVKAYPLSKSFNDGPYARVAAGFGQMTTKRQNEATNLYRHQYAIGLTAAGALGYTLPIGRFGLGLEVELEYSNRNGTADTRGSTTYQSGQLGGNLVLSF